MAPGEAIPDLRNLRELQDRAQGEVPEPAYDYIAGGSGDEATLSANVQAYDRYRLRHRALRDVADRTTATTVLGTEVEMPALVAPTAFHRLVHDEGEAATARGAAQAGTLLCASTLSTVSLEEIAEASSGPRWFQLYIYRDRSLTEDLVRRAEEAGYEAVVVTVDSPVWGRRERDVENDFGLPDDLRLANFPDLDQETLPEPPGGGNALAHYVEEQLDPSLTWDDIAWLQEQTDLPVLVKGLAHPDDAREAARRGVDGIVVSNHGGRQLDAGVATVDALPGIVDAIRQVAGAHGPEVYVDGGIRRGTDVLTALCLGARAVLVGRPLVWSLACGGAAGVEQALDLLREEVDNALALAGLRSPAEAGRDMVERVEPGDGR
jgi:4-hydroxymandelate oxidase